MMQKIHWFLMMFTWDVPLILVKPGSQSIQGHSHKRSSPYDGSYQDSHFSTIIKSNQYAKKPLASRTFNPNQISLLVFKRSTGMMQKVHLFLMMFNKCSAQPRQSHIKGSSYDGSQQDSHFSTIIKSVCQTTFGIKNFQIQIKYPCQFLKDQLG